jgi:SAM-dependent methyltransferase
MAEVILRRLGGDRSLQASNHHHTIGEPLDREFPRALLCYNRRRHTSTLAIAVPDAVTPKERVPMFKSNRTIAKAEVTRLDLSTRVSIEAQITDARAVAIDRAQFERLETRYTQWVAATPWRQYLFRFLGPLDGKMMLDIGCGYAMTPIIFALAGATVYAIDVAPQTIATNQWFADIRGVADRVHLHVGPAEMLPYPNAMFDLVYGGAALHHLQLKRAGPEIARVLKPGARGGFQDPLGHNPLLEFARDRLAYKDKHPVKGTDLPLRIDDVHAFGSHFAAYTYRSFELFAMASKLLHLKSTSRLCKLLNATDNLLFDTIPYLQRYARFVITCVTA